MDPISSVKVAFSPWPTPLALTLDPNSSWSLLRGAQSYVRPEASMVPWSALRCEAFSVTNVLTHGFRQGRPDYAVAPSATGP
jgi:hypothetical protein